MIENLVHCKKKILPCHKMLQGMNKGADQFKNEEAAFAACLTVYYESIG